MCLAQYLARSRDSINGGILLPSRATSLGKKLMGKKRPLFSCIGVATQLLIIVSFYGSNGRTGRCCVLVLVHKQLLEESGAVSPGFSATRTCGWDKFSQPPMCL